MSTPTRNVSRGKTTPASTAGSFTSHAHGTPDVEISEETPYGEGWARADSLKPGDRFWREDPSRWNDDDPYVVVEVIGEQTAAKDLFGRAMISYQCRRLDTGQEGGMTFGPEGRVRTAPPSPAASPYDADIDLPNYLEGHPAATVDELAAQIAIASQQARLAPREPYDNDHAPLGRHAAWAEIARDVKSESSRLADPRSAGRLRDQCLRCAIEAARTEAIYASGDDDRRFRDDGDRNEHEWTTAHNAASVEAWAYFAVAVDDGGQPDPADVTNVAAYAREWASEGPFLGGDPAPAADIDLTTEYAHAVTGDEHGGGFWGRRSVDRYR